VIRYKVRTVQGNVVKVILNVLNCVNINILKKFDTLC
jgi:hypothetical protein